MELLKKTVPVTCAVIIREGKILTVQRSSHDPVLPEMWEFPGGKTEAGETAIDCIKREIQEELELTIDPFQRLDVVSYDYGTVIIEMTPFLATIISGSMKLNDHRDFRWLELTELDQPDWAPADLPVVRWLKDHPEVVQ